MRDSAHHQNGNRQTKTRLQGTSSGDLKIVNGVARPGCCSIDALSPGVFASLDPRLSAGNLSGCRFPAKPRWSRRSTTRM